jgi:hypothetical protein
MEKALLTMSKQELNRAELMVRIQERRLTQRQAAEMLDLSVRQVERPPIGAQRPRSPEL